MFFKNELIVKVAIKKGAPTFKLFLSECSFLRKIRSFLKNREKVRYGSFQFQKRNSIFLKIQQFKKYVICKE